MSSAVTKHLSLSITLVKLMLYRRTTLASVFRIDVLIDLTIFDYTYLPLTKISVYMYIDIDRKMLKS